MALTMCQSLIHTVPDSSCRATRRARSLSRLHTPADSPYSLFVGDERADIGGGVHRITERERRRALDQAFHELVVYRLVYE